MTLQSLNYLARTSATEWLAKINIKRARNWRREDMLANRRLRIFKQLINLPCRTAQSFTIEDVIKNKNNFQIFTKKYQGARCNFRVIPSKTSLTKYRIKTITLSRAATWLKLQNLDAKNYHVEILPHFQKTKYSCIFVIEEGRVIGEIIKGPLWQLSEGDLKHRPVLFTYDFKTWQFSQKNKPMEKFVRLAVKKLRVKNSATRQKLAALTKTSFTTNHYLKGHFEFVVWPKNQLFFVEFNRLQTDALQSYQYSRDKQINAPNVIRGLCASPGTARGRAQIINDKNLNQFKKGNILICKITSLYYVPAMKRAAAIVTEKGNILSHPAIISRELGKPCLVQVKNATTKIKNGALIMVNANQGVITTVN